MMYPMMRWGVKNVFYPIGQFIDGFCMDPELIDQAYRLHVVGYWGNVA
jgi:hypothetical protein